MPYTERERISRPHVSECGDVKGHKAVSDGSLPSGECQSWASTEVAAYASSDFLKRSGVAGMPLVDQPELSGWL